MKSISRKPIAVGVLLSAALLFSAHVSPDSHNTSDTIDRAVSLKALQRHLAKCTPQGQCSDTVRYLAGLTWIKGYMADIQNRDIILVGTVTPDMPSLHTDDLIVALKNAWYRYAQRRGTTRYYAYPGCSIDPNPNMIKGLEQISGRVLDLITEGKVEEARRKWNRTCELPQRVRVMGSPFDSHFAQVMVIADYKMKSLVNGADELDIPGFTSLTKRHVDRASKDLEQGRPLSIPASSLNRFWFYPGEQAYVVDEGAVEIKRSPVILLTEKEFLTSQGQITSTGTVDPEAAAFAAAFTKHYQRIAASRPIYRELENLFRFVALAKLLQFNEVDKATGLDVSYLLDNFKEPTVEVNRRVKGVGRVVPLKHVSQNGNTIGTVFVSLQTCGGVSIEIDIKPAYLRPDSSGELQSRRNDVLSMRPDLNALWWDYSNAGVNREQAGRRYCDESDSANRLANNR